MSDIARLGFAVDTKGLAKGEKALDSFARKGKLTEEKTSKTVKNINNDFLALNKTIGLVATSLVLIGGAQITRNLIEFSDTWKGLNSQIRQVTKSERELIIVREQLLELSNETRSSFEGTVKLFAEIKRSTDSLGISTDKQIKITRTLNNLFVSGGRPMSEINGAIRQLTQGFAAGALRGDEFNSVAENAPRIMDALGNSLRMTRGELREFAATGGITAEIMIEALDEYSSTAQKLADQTEKTFSQSFQIATNNTIKFIGEANSLSKTFIFLGDSIVSTSENLNSLTDAGIAFAAVYGVGVVGSITKSIAANVGKIASDIAAENAAILLIAAEKKKALSVASSAVATTIAEREMAAAKSIGIKFTLAQLEAESLLENVRLKAQITDIGRTKTASRMAEIQLARLAITKQLTAADAQHAALSFTAVEAETAQALATSNLAKTQTVATGTTRALGVATKFLLGPWGLLITAIGIGAVAFFNSKSEADDLTKSLV